MLLRCIHFGVFEEYFVFDCKFHNIENMIFLLIEEEKLNFVQGKSHITCLDRLARNDASIHVQMDFLSKSIENILPMRNDREL